MILNPDTTTGAGSDQEADALNTVRYVKREIFEAVSFLMKHRDSHLRTGSSSGEIELTVPRYSGRLSFDPKTSRVKELKEIVRGGRREIHFRDDGSHQVLELKMKGNRKTLFLRVVEEVESGMIFLTGFMILQKEVFQLF
jgi:hypothetical protein